MRGRFRHRFFGRRQRRKRDGSPHFTIALAGNANVGKSVIFNRLTGSDQITGNWPGKTVERAKGFLHYNNYDVDIIDLPGIYSLSTFSLEEVVSREYIAQEKPDVIINVIGAPVLERNLFFTLQLMEMNIPLIVCLNQMDIAISKGIMIDTEKLEKLLGVPVIATVASRGEGIEKLKETAFRLAEQHQHHLHHQQIPIHQAINEPGITHTTRYSANIEERIENLTRAVEEVKTDLGYPSRWVAIKLLEGDSKIKEILAEKNKPLVATSEAMAKEMQDIFHQPSYVAMTSERYALANEITENVQSSKSTKRTLADRLDKLATGRVTGYVFAVVIIAGLLAWTFILGTALSELLANAFSFFQSVDPQVSGTFWAVIWNGLFGGLVAGVTLVIPYVVPFYLMLAVLEDSGILTRVAFMLDSAMHRMGLHGKAIIPIILGYGCNVPAIYATRIMGSWRERVLTGLAITFSPCAARTIIIFGLAAQFLGIWWAVLLYGIAVLLTFTVVRVAVRVMPGESSGLIMEMHSFKAPSFTTILKQTWARTKSLIFMVMPIYMVTSAVVQGIYALGWLQPVNNAFSFLTSGWLGLPVMAGILLIFGAARKEMVLLMAVVLFGSNLSAVFTNQQIFVLALVSMVYPCFATIGVLIKEYGWKAAWAIIGVNVGVALLVGGIADKIWGLFS
ncbi:MAG: ferrous iron transport protein B [Dehalococcoidales bacterium]|nr:ferrous iron transport protein B [Dehalococcoidales bacterium]